MGKENKEQAAKVPQAELDLKEAQERTQRVNEKVSAILKEEDCSLVPTLNMTGNQVQHLVQVVPNAKKSTIVTPK